MRFLKLMKSSVWSFLVACLVLFPASMAFAQCTSEQMMRTDDVTGDGSQLIFKVIGGSDRVTITDSPEGSVIGTMNLLRAYAVICASGDHYKISDKISESVQGAELGNIGYVAKSKVLPWSTLEALHINDLIKTRKDRQALEAWDSKDKVINSLGTGSEEFEPDFREDINDTLLRTEKLQPYLVQGKFETPNMFGSPATVFHAFAPTYVEEASLEIVGDANTIVEQLSNLSLVLVFDATASMTPYAKAVTQNIEEIAASSSRLETFNLGLIFYRDKDDDVPLKEISLADFRTTYRALDTEANNMSGGGDAAEPILDALLYAAQRYDWGEQSGAKRIVFAVLNGDAKPESGVIGKFSKMNAVEVAGQLSDKNIATYTFRVGKNFGPNLIPVMTQIANFTGGTFSNSDISEENAEAFGTIVNKLVGDKVDEGLECAEKAKGVIEPKDSTTSVIALSAIDPCFREQLREIAGDFDIDPSEAGLLIRPMFIPDNKNLYSHKIFISSDILQQLTRILTQIARLDLNGETAIDTVQSIIGTFAGEDFNPDDSIRDVAAKKLGLTFQTKLLSWNLEFLAGMGPEERFALQNRIRDAGERLSDFEAANLEALERDGAVWMEIDYMP